MRRMRVKQTHPKFAFDFLNLAKQRSQCRSATGIHRLSRSRLGLPQIHPVIRGVLTDQINLAHAFADECADFRQHRFRVPAPMFSAHLRNHAKATRMITAFSNLYVSEMRRCKSESWRVVIGNVRRARLGKRAPLVIPSEVEGSRVDTAASRHGTP